MPLNESMERRFWPKVEKTSGCWNWTASKNAKGYGQIANKPERNMLAHRVAWELERGPIPDGMVIDHLCKNPACVNPAHMEVVILAENTMRGDGPTARNARASHCKRGHTLADAYVSKGMRYCRTCALEKQRLLRREGHGVLPC